jgi:CBS domain-containing protein
MNAQGEVGTSEYDEAYDDDRDVKGAFFLEPLSRVPQRPVLTVPATSTVAETIRAMNDHHRGAALIVKDGRLVGIFTERDLLQKVAGAKLDLNTTVASVMTPNPLTLPEHASIAYALHRMSIEGYRQIPLVSDDHRPTGMVGVRDIVAWMVGLFPQSLLNLPPEPTTPKSVEGG